MITYPLNNIDYTAEDAELYFCTRKSGVHDENDFDISVTGVDSSVTIGTGIAWIRNSKFSGKVVALKEPETLSMSLPDAVYDRIDSIVIRFDANQNKSEIIVKEGNPNSNPVAPSVAQDESVYELHLYHILREAGSSVISLSNITDHRKNPHYCGIMIDPVTAIDETLKKRGFAADAESVGYKLNEVKEGAAPAGYGFGGTAINLGTVTEEDALDAVLEPIFQDMAIGEVMQIRFRATRLSNFEWYGTISKYSIVHSTVRVTTSGAAFGFQKVRNDSGWQVAAWENPPMLENGEYRTVERCNGKPIYAKLINCGTFPANSTKAVAHGIENVEQFVSRLAFSDHLGLALPYHSLSSDGTILSTSCTVDVTGNAVLVRSVIDTWSEYTCYVILKYTKTTD